MAEYCLSQQILAFGQTLETQFIEASNECQRYGKNHSIFDQLPHSFTKDDLRALKQGNYSDAAIRQITSRWSRDGWIEKAEDGKHWIKKRTE